MFFLHVSRLYHLDFSKKKIESVAGLKSRVIFFLIVLNLQMVCPILILTQLFCTFAAHLYRVMLLQYFSCLLGDTIVIKLKMVSWNWSKKKLGWLSLPFLYIWTFYIATVLKYGCIWKIPLLNSVKWLPPLGSAFFLAFFFRFRIFDFFFLLNSPPNSQFTQKLRNFGRFGSNLLIFIGFFALRFPRVWGL